ncbi:unnamed protein product [Nesidiocoris tenuis]|uniref:RPAP1/MINIYO-like TPR repeats domain-containing protein n=1 Tax=Nesidiocoris tenuis TaxID=355587 RepID=A0A6H5FUJ0_9HEMI|nr:unnamed protein product [Nesidiocoris tenuis]
MKQSEIDELKDTELLKLDIIRGMMRTNILERVRALIPVLGKLLAMHLEYTGLSSSGSDLEHASAVITTISSVAKVHQDSVMPILSLACQCRLKWINQYSEIDRPSARLLTKFIHPISKEAPDKHFQRGWRSTTLTSDFCMTRIETLLNFVHCPIEIFKIGLNFVVRFSFRELLEQYAGVSYCDPVFCRYILVPLAQKHDVKYKKIVWSELAYILRLIRSSPSEVNMEHYLTPTEMDSNMLMTYLRAVATGQLIALKEGSKLQPMNRLVSDAHDERAAPK